MALVKWNHIRRNVTIFGRRTIEWEKTGYTCHPERRGCVIIMNVNHINPINCLCEERSDVAISCYGSNCTTEIATLPLVARDDAVLRHTPRVEG